MTALGCGATGGKVAQENDRLRAENLQLTQQVEALQQRVAAQTTEIELLKQQAAERAGVEPLPEGLRSPVCTSIEIDGTSGGVDTNEDGVDDAVRLYLRTLDARRRFVQTIARVKVTIAATPPGGEAVTLATETIDAPALDAAYRAGLGGTHYTLIVPVTTAPPDAVSQVSVSIQLDDLVTGATHTTQKLLRWKAE